MKLLIRPTFLIVLSAVALAASAACSKSKPKATTPTAVAEPTRPTRPGPDRVPTVTTIDRGDGAPSEQAQFGPVYFEFDSSQLSAAGRDELAHAADHLGKARERISVEGHTDERGTTEYNLALGQQRANAVAEYLRRLGVGAERIDTITYGEERPAADGDDEGAYARNRRAELVLRP